ncbi:MAG: hypothetical protein IPP40_07755 [bacterium]|nr:hypothetical protein [bacterium]
MKSMLAMLMCLCCIAIANAQIEAGGTARGLSAASSNLPAAPIVTMPHVDNQALLAEDADLPKDEQSRFAAQLPVNLNLNTSGTWANMPDGGRVWRLRIMSEDAYSLALLFDEWYLPKGAELFVYNDNGDDVLGALTSFNNWVDGTNVIRHIKGNALTVELYEPSTAMNQSVLSIYTVCHAYKNVFGYPERNPLDSFGDSGACNNNILCPEAAAWQDEKQGVCMITSGGSRICSGSMIRANVPNWPAYFLTANHCGFSGSWVFVFNYQSPQCAPNADGSTAQTVANATLRANNADSDFELLELSAQPPAAYNVFYNGWNRNDAASTSSVCIHHPRGDVKKWTIDNNAPVNGTWSGTPANSHWRILAWDDGTTEPGSSGSPLFDQNSRITGQLHGGTATCSNNIDDYFGKLSLSWTGSGTNATRLSNWLDPNGTGVTTLDGSYTITVANDNCPGTFVTLPFNGSGNTSSATASGGACAWVTTPDVWYYFGTSACSSQVNVSLCGSSYDTFLEIRQGGNCPGDNPVDCTDDDCGASGLQSQSVFTAVPNSVYYVRVFGFNGAVGAYTIDITETPLDPAPSNDNCSNTLPINTLPFTHSGSTCSAANDYSFCFMGSSNDVVYALNVAECQSIAVSTCGGQTNYDTRLTVRTDGSCPGTTEVGCNDDFCGLQSQITFDATAGVTYYVVVAGFSSRNGRYTLNVTGNGHIGSPGNDNCSGAINVNALPFNHSGNTTCAIADYPYSGCGFEDSRDVVYHLNVPSCQTVQVSTCSANPSYDTRLQVMSGGACPGNTLVACNDDACDLQSTVTFGALANMDYYILVRGYWSGAYGQYDLAITSVGGYVSPNDQCPGAAINAIPYVGFGNTACSNDNYPNGDCYFSESSAEDVYTMTLGATQGVIVSLCGSGYDTGLKVRRGGACPGDVMVVCDDDANCGGVSTLLSNVEFTAQAGVTYYIQVSGFTSNSGPYTIHVDPKTINPIDSLVIKEVSGTVQLWWEDVDAAYYIIYRSANPNDVYAPANLHSSSVTTTFTEYEALSNQIYYGVSAVPDYLVPVLLAAGLGERPVQEVFEAAMAELKLTAFPIEPIDFYSGIVSENVELAIPNKKATVQAEGIHMFGPGLSTENPVPGKNYLAE